MTDNEIVHHAIEYMNSLNITDEDEIQDLFLLVFENKEKLHSKIDVRVVIYKAINREDGCINISRKKKMEEEKCLIPLSDDLLEYEVDDYIIYRSLVELIHFIAFDRFDYKITDRERRVIALRFGIMNDKYNPECYDSLIYRVIGEIEGVTREYIRHCEAVGLRKLRHPSRSNKLRDYL